MSRESVYVGRALAVTLVAVICLSSAGPVNAFTSNSNSRTITPSPFLTTPPNSIIQPKHPSTIIQSPLFVAASQSSEENIPAIRSIDAQMEKTKRKQAKYEEKLSQYASELQALEQQKKQYLDGLSVAKTPPGGSFSETALRSGVKAICWRIIAGTVTLITSLKFSGSLSTALQIVSSDFFSKAATMFIGERLMNKSQAGRKSGAESAGRSLAKALIWRLFAICNTLSVSFFISGNFKMASKIAGSDAVFKTALMFFYERFWAKVEWGKEYNIEFSI